MIVWCASVSQINAAIQEPMFCMMWNYGEINTVVNEVYNIFLVKKYSMVQVHRRFDEN
jgi:hypothetical protein